MSPYDLNRVWPYEADSSLWFNDNIINAYMALLDEKSLSVKCFNVLLIGYIRNPTARHNPVAFIEKRL